MTLLNKILEMNENILNYEHRIRRETLSLQQKIINKQIMKVERFFSQYNLFDDVQSILADLIYGDQICGPSNEYEEQDMERSAKLAVYSLLNSCYADGNGEIDASNVDFEELYDSMHNAIFKEFNHDSINHDDYDEEDFDDSGYDDYKDDYGTHYGEYAGSYAQDVMGYSDDEINDAFDGEPDAYWNID